MKKNLEQQEKELEDKIRAFETEREAFEEQFKPDEYVTLHYFSLAYHKTRVVTVFACFYKVQYECVQHVVMDGLSVYVCIRFCGPCFCWKFVKLDDIWQRIIMFRVCSMFQSGAGQSVPPLRLRQPCGSISHPRMFLATILRTENGATTPPTTTLYTLGLTREFHSFPQETVQQAIQPSADQPHERRSHTTPANSAMPQSPTGQKRAPAGFSDLTGKLLYYCYAHEALFTINMVETNANNTTNTTAKNYYCSNYCY